MVLVLTKSPRRMKCIPIGKLNKTVIYTQLDLNIFLGLRTPPQMSTHTQTQTHTHFTHCCSLSHTLSHTVPHTFIAIVSFVNNVFLFGAGIIESRDRKSAFQVHYQYAEAIALSDNISFFF